MAKSIYTAMIKMHAFILQLFIGNQCVQSNVL